MNARAQLGIDLWRLYAAQGRRLPASWVARAVGLSPTTMGKYLLVHCDGYQPKKGWSPERGWNWYAAQHVRRLAPMDDIYWSNGKRFEAGGELSEEDIAKIQESAESTNLTFEMAMEIVEEEGLAVCRTVNCERVIFRVGVDPHPSFGRSDREGNCIAEGPYVPTFDDITGDDWMIDAHVRK